MLQKTQWMLATTGLAVSVCLVAAARPAQAQVRIHLTRGMVHSTQASGIIIPPSSPGIVIPSSSPAPTPPSHPPTIVSTPAPPPPPAPTITRAHTITITVPTPPPAPTPTPNPSLDASWFGGPSVSMGPSLQSGGQGFSAGPSLLGSNRLPLDHYVNRVPPDITGNGPSVRTVITHH